MPDLESKEILKLKPRWILCSVVNTHENRIINNVEVYFGRMIKSKRYYLTLGNI